VDSLRKYLKSSLLRKLLPLMPRIAASIDAGETVIEVR
jgi:hypothetical protein